MFVLPDHTEPLSSEELLEYGENLVATALYYLDQDAQ
jgi:hypothetical protein